MEHLDSAMLKRMLAGELDVAALQRAQEHLARCSACAGLLADEQRWQRLAALNEPPPAEEQSLARVLERVPGRAPGSRRKLWAMLAAGGSVAVLGTLLAVYTGTRHPPDSPNPEAPPGLLRNLDALATIQRDPWIVDEFETLRTLDTLIAGGQH